MNQQRDNVTEGVMDPPVRFPFGHRVRYLLAGLRSRLGPLDRQMSRLGRWVEDDVFHAVDKVEDEALFLKMHSGGKINLEQQGTKKSPSIDGLRELCELLGRLGICRIKVDTRLESNQIKDVLTLVYTYQRELIAPRTINQSRGISNQLYSDEGFHFNCMQIHLRDDVLVVQYSYCVTRLSRAVRWFERRHRSFGDHRALFHAAPRYGLLAAISTLMVLLGFLLTRSLIFLVTATAVEAAIFFVAVYVFMRGLGCVEYDNEESAYRLGRAHATLTQYADRIHYDLSLARTVQQKLLPDRQQMPLPDRLAWASSFSPETEVGGDYFDTAPMDKDRVVIVFADVSGHGMAAALITVIVKMVFDSWSKAGWSVSDFVCHVNRDLCRFIPDGSFVVLIAGEYDDTKGCVTFVNSGHSPKPIYLPSDPSQLVTDLPKLGSMLLGVEEDIEIRETVQHIPPGGAILLATDGLSEARNKKGEMYGKNRLVEHLENHRSIPLGNLVECLMQDVCRFSEGVEQSDDQTVLAFQVRQGSIHDDTTRQQNGPESPGGGKSA